LYDIDGYYDDNWYDDANVVNCGDNNNDNNAGNDNNNIHNHNNDNNKTNNDNNNFVICGNQHFADPNA